MTTLTILKRSTALAALVTLPLALGPVTAGAENQQTQNQQTQDQTATDAQAQGQATGEQKGPANETGIVTEGKEGTQSGEAPEMAPTTGAQAQGEATSEQKGPASETGTVTEGKEGTQSGEAPDMAPSGDQAGQAESGQTSQTGQQVQTGQQSQTGQSQPGQQSQTGQQSRTDQQSQADQQADRGGKAGAGEDLVVAKVGDREIRQSDILGVIGMLPPELQQQPPETLIPIALDQLVMRELILQEAKDSGLENDPGVASMSQDAPEQAKEDAMVQAWLDRELGKAVTDQKVEQTYDAVKQQMGDQAPPMEALRPQIEQELRQQAFLDLSNELQADAEITLYGPDGQPVTQ